MNMVPKVDVLTLALCLVITTVELRAASPDEGTLAAAGIRKLASAHLTLYTDLPSSPDVDQMPQVFELAISRWAKFFEVDPSTFDGWKVKACVIQNKQRFRDYKLLPENLPPFLHGFQRFDEIWVYEQPSPYYRQHLLLHEGTHAAMNRIFGRVGPGWYREGVAELLGTHRFENGQLTLPYFPEDRKVVEHWGRIKIVREDIVKGNLRSIPSLVNTQTRDFLKVESYAWCWALQAFGHAHPKFKNLFRALQEEMFFSELDVTQKFMREYKKRKFEIDAAWSVFLSQLDYGYDSQHDQVFETETKELEAGKIISVQVDASKPWQSTGFLLPSNSKLDIAATGRFRVVEEVDSTGQPPICWESEPQGVTIEYYQGRPLGQLIAAVINLNDTSHAEGFTQPKTIGRRARLDSADGGMLYFRINERADRLHDNKGQLSVKLRLVK